MKRLCYLFLLYLFVLSCNLKNKEKQNNKLQSKIIDVTNLESNAFVFTEIESTTNQIYIIPVDIEDSSIFKTIDVDKAIKNKICIQLNTGCFSNFCNEFRKNVMSYKACNLPYEKMYYSRVFIQYKNYEEVLISPTDNNGQPIKLETQDSCNTKVITGTDTSVFNYRIYKF
jgi:hypothetical protein